MSAPTPSRRRRAGQVLADAAGGAAIGAVASVLARMLSTGTGPGWLVGLALIATLAGAGLMARAARDGAAARARRVALSVGIVAGAAGATIVAPGMADPGGMPRGGPGGAASG